VGIFYCVSDRRLNAVFKKDLDTAIEQITETIRYAKEKNPSLIIRYTPEDTVRSEFGNVAKAAQAAVKAGADIISIADTTGYMIPGTERSMYDYVKRLKEALASADLHPQIAVHCHNDRGLGVANAIDAYRAGVDVIDATVLGLGERAGIVDLATLLTILTVDFGETKWNLEKLPELYDLVSNYSGVKVPPNLPVTGGNAFTHCAGVHTHAASKNPMHYESLAPELIGRKTQFSLDHMSGVSSVRYAFNLIGANDADEELTAEVLKTIKLVGKRGRCVDLQELRVIVESCKASQDYPT
jgi:2-isopropylmalate synthase